MLALLFASTSLCAHEPTATQKGEDMLRQSTELILVAPDSSYHLLEEVRKHGLAEPWRIDMVEAKYYYYNRHYRRAENVLLRALSDNNVASQPKWKLQLNRAMLRVYTVLGKDRQLMYSIDVLKKDASRADLLGYHVIADFVYGSRLHYHGEKRKGYQICWKAIEAMKNSNFKKKHSELFRFYTDMIEMLMRDHNYQDALNI